MLNFFLRWGQKFILPFKVILLLGSLGILTYMVVNQTPGLLNVVLASILLFIILSVILSFKFSANTALILGLAVSFFLFLKAVGLLSPLNLGLFAVFLVLLGLYLRKR